RAVERDIPDLVSMLMATGLRIGEALALRWADLDLTAGTLTVRGTVVRVNGKGLMIKETKTAAGTRTLVLPAWCVDMLQLRATGRSALVTDKSPVFPALDGGLRD